MTAKAAVDNLLAAMAQRDAAAVVAAAKKGGKLEVVPLDVKGAASTKGKEYFGELFAAFPDLEVEVTHTVIAGDKALLDVVVRGTPKEPYLEIPVKDGKALESRQAWRVDVEGDEITGLKIFFCLNELKWSLGANKTYEEAIAGVRA